ncbi:unnamed protein product [Trichogramma brassicae]|uniref:Uncharacterized protein n=1 Tax=Trichogramma brassicae TaxID=86971 RepID=A0A6H5J3E9_9HYME|nr:unnamed protein product [Trichogramma brassicae]
MKCAFTGGFSRTARVNVKNIAGASSRTAAAASAGLCEPKSFSSLENNAHQTRVLAQAHPVALFATPRRSRSCSAAIGSSPLFMSCQVHGSDALERLRYHYGSRVIYVCMIIYAE